MGLDATCGSIAVDELTQLPGLSWVREARAVVTDLMFRRRPVCRDDLSLLPPAVRIILDPGFRDDFHHAWRVIMQEYGRAGILDEKLKQAR